MSCLALLVKLVYLEFLFFDELEMNPSLKVSTGHELNFYPVLGVKNEVSLRTSG